MKRHITIQCKLDTLENFNRVIKAVEPLNDKWDVGYSVEVNRLRFQFDEEPCDTTISIVADLKKAEEVQRLCDDIEQLQTPWHTDFDITIGRVPLQI